jgi:L-gulonate 5-dehydrogenase
VVVGISQAEGAIPVSEFSRKEISVVGSRNSAGEFADAVSLVQRNRDRVSGLVSHRFSLDEVPSAIEFARSNPALVEKVVILTAGSPDRPASGD